VFLADLDDINAEVVDLRVVGVMPERPAPPAPSPAPEEPDNGWPLGPLTMRRAAVERLVTALQTDPEVIGAAQEDQRGLTKNRVARVGRASGAFPADQSKQLAESCIVWFDRAGILAPPSKPKEHPLNQPRPITLTDPAQIAERLRATPIPDADAVRAAFA
jgi:hypothetical protein